MRGWTGGNRAVDTAVSQIYSDVWGHLPIMQKHGEGDGIVFEGIADDGQEYGAVYDWWTGRIDRKAKRAIEQDGWRTGAEKWAAEPERWAAEPERRAAEPEGWIAWSERGIAYRERQENRTIGEAACWKEEVILSKRVHDCKCGCGHICLFNELSKMLSEKKLIINWN